MGKNIEDNNITLKKNQNNDEYSDLQCVREKKANYSAKISMILIIAACCMAGMTEFICDYLYNSFSVNINDLEDVKFVVWIIAAVLYLLSLAASVLGILTMRTQKTKIMFEIHILGPILIVFSILIIYGLVMIIFGWFR
nr:hypothetical protein [Lachnospiraceae bacterium]